MTLAAVAVALVAIYGALFWAARHWDIADEDRYAPWIATGVTLLTIYFLIAGFLN